MSDMQLIIRRTKSVTRPVLKIAGKAVFFTVQGPIHKAPLMEGQKAQTGKDGSVLPPPDLMDVLNLEDGQDCVIVVNTVLGKNLNEKYPNDSYVGKSFEVSKFAPDAASGKRYSTFQIYEVSVETPKDQPAVDTKTATKK